MTTHNEKDAESFAFAGRVLIATLVVVSVVLLLLFVWYAADLLLLVFAGVLVSILLRSSTEFVQQKTRLPYWLALTSITLGFVVVVVVTAWLVMGRIGVQVNEFQMLLPRAIENVRGFVGQFEWADRAINNLTTRSDWLTTRGGAVLSQLGGIFSTTAGAIVNIIIVFIIGVYLASQPDLYTRGLKNLVPVRHRHRTGEVLDVIESALRRWLAGRFVLMFMNGALTALGLWLLNIPLAVTLGIFAGILNFVPNFGPWIAAIPAVLIAFLQGPQQALYVGLLYIVMQSIDGYVLTPLVDRKSVELPPVLTITAQILLGLAFGVMGLLLASPLTAMAVILVKMLYVEDLLGEETKVKESMEGET